MGDCRQNGKRVAASGRLLLGFCAVVMTVAIACRGAEPGSSSTLSPTAQSPASPSLQPSQLAPSGTPMASAACGQFEDCSITKADIPMPQGWAASDGAAHTGSTSLNVDEAVTLAREAGTAIVGEDPYVRFLWVVPERPDPEEMPAPRWVVLSIVPAPPFFAPYDPTGERTPLETQINYGYVMLDPEGGIVFSGVATYFPLDEVPTLPPR